MREENPKINVVDAGTIATEDNKQARIRYFTGDSHGNYEAAAYVIERKVVANIILTARNKTAFDSALPAFRKLVATYRFVSDDPSKLDLHALEAAELQRRKAASPPNKYSKGTEK
jgi:hypothetical protein